LRANLCYRPFAVIIQNSYTFIKENTQKKRHETPFLTWFLYASLIFTLIPWCGHKMGG